MGTSAAPPPACAPVRSGRLPGPAAAYSTAFPYWVAVLGGLGLLPVAIPFNLDFVSLVRRIRRSWAREVGFPRTAALLNACRTIRLVIPWSLVL